MICKLTFNKIYKQAAYRLGRSHWVQVVEVLKVGELASEKVHDLVGWHALKVFSDHHCQKLLHRILVALVERCRSTLFSQSLGEILRL